MGLLDAAFWTRFDIRVSSTLQGTLYRERYRNGLAAMKRKVLSARFYGTATGAEPVRKWLKALSREDKRIVGTDIATVEFGWPVGMPTCRPLASRRGLLEVRSSLTQNRIARVLFCIHQGQMVLLRGFIKKTQQTPENDLDLAVKRQKEVEGGKAAK
jgi:phage-related protein